MRIRKQKSGNTSVILTPKEVGYLKSIVDLAYHGNGEYGEFAGSLWSALPGESNVWGVPVFPWSSHPQKLDRILKKFKEKARG